MEPVVVDLPRDPLLDLDAWVGQRQASFRFNLTDSVTKAVLGEINPIRDTATLTHDTSRTIKRQIQLSLGKHDSANINPVSDRVNLFMTFSNGAEYPLGKYMFTLFDKNRYTSGSLASATLNDEMFIIDQEIKTGINGYNKPPNTVINDVLDGLGFRVDVERSDFILTESWGPGTTRGTILDAIASSCDYFSPWLDHQNVLRFIRTFDPMTKIPSLDYDASNLVTRSGVVDTSDVLTAPNTFVVISNSGPNQNLINPFGQRIDPPQVAGAFSIPIIGTAQVPDTAPNSVEKRGFEIPKTTSLQVNTQNQATAAALGIMQKSIVAERVTLDTVPDPRNDSYDVIKWDDKIWLELSWSMALQEGGTMSHVLRRAYR